jgi:predicted homoserine dehydrogenase-like protein
MLTVLRTAERTSPIISAVVGAGFVARGLVHRLARRETMAAPLVVNRTARRALAILAEAGYAERDVAVSDDADVVSQALAEGRPAVMTDADVLPAVRGIEVVVEATGAMEHGTRVILAALESGRHVVSMNAEVDALLGHHLDAVAAANGVTYTIADGDQPGVLLRMIDETHQLGLEVAVALNCKRNLDVHQSQADSRPYAERDGTSVAMTTAFGDGTKMHIENVVTANLSGLRPPPIGTPGVMTELARGRRGRPGFGDHRRQRALHARRRLRRRRRGARTLRGPGVRRPYLRYGKLGDGPWYPLFRPYHLIHMEVPTTIEQVVAGGPALGQRTETPVASCVAVAKRDLASGDVLDGIGGDACYGVAADHEEGAGLLPIGLAQHATLRRDVAQDRPVTLDDVELDESALLVGTLRDRFLRGRRQTITEGHAMRFEPLAVEGAFLVRADRRGDARGWFARVFCAETFAEHGLEPAVAQINLAETARAGTVRGLHYQLPPPRRPSWSAASLAPSSTSSWTTVRRHPPSVPGTVRSCRRTRRSGSTSRPAARTATRL